MQLCVPFGIAKTPDICLSSVLATDSAFFSCGWLLRSGYSAPASQVLPEISRITKKEVRLISKADCDEKLLFIFQACSTYQANYSWKRSLRRSKNGAKEPPAIDNDRAPSSSLILRVALTWPFDSNHLPIASICIRRSGCSSMRMNWSFVIADDHLLRDDVCCTSSIKGIIVLNDWKNLETNRRTAIMSTPFLHFGGW